MVGSPTKEGVLWLALFTKTISLFLLLIISQAHLSGSRGLALAGAITVASICTRSTLPQKDSILLPVQNASPLNPANSGLISVLQVDNQRPWCVHHDQGYWLPAYLDLSLAAF